LVELAHENNSAPDFLLEANSDQIMMDDGQGQLINVSEHRQRTLLAEIHVMHQTMLGHVRMGYHDKSKTSHQEGKFHDEYLRDKEKLEQLSHELV